MPFVAVLAALLLYVLLGYLWIVLQPQLTTSTSVLAAINRVLFDLPRDNIIGLVRIGILMIAVYLIADGILSSLRRRRLQQKRDKEKSATRALLAAHTPPNTEPNQRH